MGNGTKPRLLVTGATGFVGWNTVAAARDRWDVTGVVHTHRARIPASRTVAADLTDSVAVKRIFDDVRPDGVVHLAAISQPNHCEKAPDRSHRVNVQSAIGVARLCADRGIPMVFTSTDLVFDGTAAPYRESDPTAPLSLYGRQKVMAEEGIADVHPGAALCRMPLMFGDPGPVSASFIQPMLSAMKDGRELNLFTDEYRTPVSGSTAAAGLLAALDKGVSGVLHLGGRDRISRYDFGRLLARVAGLTGSAKIAPSLQKDVSMAAVRPPDVSLDSSRAYSLGYAPGTVEEELADVISRPRRGSSFRIPEESSR